MPVSFEQVVGYILPIIGQLVYSLVGIAGLVGLWYYLFVIKRRRFWLVDVHEQKSDGKLYLVEKDRLVEKKINRGKQVIYVFRKTKTESIPPPHECVSRLGNKEYADYLRVQGEYIPLDPDEKNIPNFHNPNTRRKLWQVITESLRQIRGLPSEEVRRKYIYVPLNEALKYDTDFKPMSYDVNMMRINEIDNLDLMFQKKKDFWDKYGNIIAVGAMMVGLIVMIYFSYQYGETVVKLSLGAADKVAQPLDALVQKISGNVPTQ
jgi:hypothetical protein